jgi:CRISPR system Cascade subunit CasE
VPVPSDQLVAWLADRGPSAGFLLEKEGLVVQPGYAYARIPALGKGREDTAIRYWAVRYDGVLTVTDGDKLRQAVSGGIGPAKSFGFGLLSLAPVC